MKTWQVAFESLSHSNQMGAVLKLAAAYVRLDSGHDWPSQSIEHLPYYVYQCRFGWLISFLNQELAKCCNASWTRRKCVSNPVAHST